MKIIKIGAIWCGGCLVMNKVWNRLKENYDCEFIEYDYDMDEEEVEKYNVGNVLPVFIVMDEDRELLRLTGELSYDELEEKLKEVGI